MEAAQTRVCRLLYTLLIVRSCPPIRQALQHWNIIDIPDYLERTQYRDGQNGIVASERQAIDGLLKAVSQIFMLTWCEESGIRYVHSRQEPDQHGAGDTVDRLGGMKRLCHHPYRARVICVCQRLNRRSLT